MKKRILVVAAHPDDEVLGCGATLARYAREGHECHVLILAEGMTARPGMTGEAGHDGVERLRQAAQAAGRILGAASVELLGFPDNRMDTVPLLDVVQAVEKKVEDLRPHAVFTHHRGDLNVDHEIVSRAVETATRPIGAAKTEEVYAFEIPSATEWSFSRPESAFHPNQFVDIAETLAVKIDALKAYATEIRAFPHPRSPEALDALARYRGSQSGLMAAEAFSLVRRIV